MSLRSKAIYSVFWLSFISYALMPINFISNLFLARLLSPEIFGTYAFALSIKDIIGLFFSFNLGMAFVNSRGEQEDFSALLCLSCCLSFIYILFGVSGFFVLTSIKDKTIALVFFISCLVQSAGFISQAFFAPLQKIFEFKKISIATSVTGAISSIICVLFAFCHFGIWSMLLRDLFTAIILLIIAPYISPFRFNGQFHFNRIREMLTFTFKQLISSSCEILSIRIPNMLIGWRMGQQFLGHYSQANYLNLIPNLAIAPFTQTVSFSVYTSLRGQQEKMEEGILLSNYVIIRFMLILSIAVFLVGDKICLFLLGSNWDTASNIFKNSALFIFLIPFFSNVKTIAYSYQKQWAVSTAYLMATATFVVAIVSAPLFNNQLLIPWGLGIGIFLGLLLILRILIKNVGIKLHLNKIIIPPLLLFTIVVSISIFNNNFAINIFITFLLLLLLFFSERKFIRQAFSVIQPHITFNKVL